MKIGCPKEIKPQEFRVGMTPNAAHEAVANGHEVVIETNAGNGAGFADADYVAAGAKILGTAKEVFAAAEMIVKVKEPQAVERKMLREGQILFTYLHLAPDPDQTTDLLASGATCIAYETVTDRNGGLPLLAPMSEVAGRLAPQVGACQPDMGHEGAVKGRLRKRGTPHVGLHKIGSARLDLAQIRPRKVGVAEPGACNICATQIGAAEIDTTQIGPTQVRFREIDFLTGMCAAPPIPRLDALCQQGQLLRICHTHGSFGPTAFTSTCAISSLCIQ